MAAMIKKILKPINRFLAKYYWAYLKEEIDDLGLAAVRGKFRSIGKKVQFKGGGMIFHPENIILGDYVKIGENYFLMGIGGIEIGDGSRLGMNVSVHSGNHDFRNSSMIPYDKGHVKQKTTIGKAVWIGSNVNILPGVTIGDGAIVGMGTTVSKNINPYEIVVGSGQRVIGAREKEVFEEGLSNENFYGKEYH